MTVIETITIAADSNDALADARRAIRDAIKQVGNAKIAGPDLPAGDQADVALDKLPLPRQRRDELAALNVTTLAAYVAWMQRNRRRGFDSELTAIGIMPGVDFTELVMRAQRWHSFRQQDESLAVPLAKTAMPRCIFYEVSAFRGGPKPQCFTIGDLIERYSYQDIAGMKQVGKSRADQLQDALGVFGCYLRYE